MRNHSGEKKPLTNWVNRVRKERMQTQKAFPEQSMGHGLSSRSFPDGPCDPEHIASCFWVSVVLSIKQR